MPRRLIVILPLFRCSAAFGAEVTASLGEIVPVPNAVVYGTPAQREALSGGVRS